MGFLPRGRQRAQRVNFNKLQSSTLHKYRTAFRLVRLALYPVCGAVPRIAVVHR